LPSYMIGYLEPRMYCNVYYQCIGQRTNGAALPLPCRAACGSAQGSLAAVGYLQHNRVRPFGHWRASVLHDRSRPADHYGIHPQSDRAWAGQMRPAAIAGRPGDRTRRRKHRLFAESPGQKQGRLKPEHLWRLASTRHRAWPPVTLPRIGFFEPPDPDRRGQS
jgi:hypothetical protein